MSEPWKQWEGQTVDGKFSLRQFLGSTHHSAVFLAQTVEPQPKNAAIKFLFSGASNADTQLALWKRAAHLSHPNLLAIYDCGRCRLGDSDLLYVVMEHAEENLGDVLPQRPLSPEETRDFLEPALDVLVYLHGKGLAHGHLKPSNLLATRDCLKLSSDAVLTIGAGAQFDREADAYDAPELRTAAVTAKADAWSLGATLVEALTQEPPFAPPQAGDPAIPDSLPEEFREIAGHALRRHEAQRWSIGEIAARLNLAPLAAAAVASVAAPAVPAAVISPLSVPLATEPAVPLAKLPAAPEISPRRPAQAAKRSSSRSSFDYFVPAVLVTAVIIGLIFAVPKIFNFQRPSGTPTPQVASEAKMQTAPGPAAEANPVKPEPAVRKPVSRPAEPPTPTTATAVLRTDSSSSTPVRAKSADEVEGRGQVLDQVLPKPAPKALETIQGTVRVVVKVQVEASGSVSDAELDSPGPSKYFADLSEKAARQWQFAGAESDGHSVPSAWLIRFEFSPSGVRAFPQQTAP
ncbi:MAG TPA: protein kinase [Candidatus Acidoferrum sp.]|nr:protein kinase [Candidatus Acidoferrum sp.]